MILLQGILDRSLSHRLFFGLTYKHMTCLLLYEGRRPAALPQVLALALPAATKVILNLAQNARNPHVLFIVWKSRSVLLFLELCPVSNVGHAVIKKHTQSCLKAPVSSRRLGCSKHGLLVRTTKGRILLCCSQHPLVECGSFRSPGAQFWRQFSPSLETYKLLFF